MAERTAHAEWHGTLRDGQGTMELGSGAFRGEYSFASRFASGVGTNPEELLGAAHAGCFSMALSAGLTAAGHAPRRIQTTATVRIEARNGGFAITHIALTTRGSVPGMDQHTFQLFAEEAKQGCPVSKALAGVPSITLTASLE